MPKRLCLEARCASEAVYRGRCRPHSRDRERTTHPNKSIYNSKRWKLCRRNQLYHHPLCAVCGDVATDVDHIRPIENGGHIWHPDNLRSLCHSCHSEKTRREQVT